MVIILVQGLLWNHTWNAGWHCQHLKMWPGLEEPRLRWSFCQLLLHQAMALAYNPCPYITEVLWSSCLCLTAPLHPHQRCAVLPAIPKVLLVPPVTIMEDSSCRAPFSVAVTLKESFMEEGKQFVQTLSVYILSHSYFRIPFKNGRLLYPSVFWPLSSAFKIVTSMDHFFCHRTEFPFVLQICVWRVKISKMITFSLTGK